MAKKPPSLPRWVRFTPTRWVSFTAALTGSSAIRQLALESGLEVVSIREPAFPLRGLGMRSFLRRLLIVLVRRTVYPFITNTLMSGGRPVLTPNLVFVLAKPGSG